MDEGDNLKFVPKPIDAVGIRLGSGTTIQIPIGMIQRIAALRAYSNYGNSKDWMEKLSTTYVVAIATRSADALLMQHIQNALSALSINCAKCKEASIGLSVIREKLFPTLKLLREHANQLIHHLDEPHQKGIAGLNIEGVYNYCYPLVSRKH